ncbi:PfaD family polyunsaturated fatty acid/polyketide biosynthesis protein [Alteromonas sp. a30]|nr:PfaD family polyunsaturated fatty acid/polyketide biosynthesis protein [Alteromonas sp. a30]
MSASQISAKDLGSAAFCRDYGLKYAYATGAMYKGIASKELVIAMGKAGLMGFLGAGGLKLDRLEQDIIDIKNALNQGQSFGVNLLCDHENPSAEMAIVDLFLKHDVKFADAAAYTQITPAIVKFRLSGLPATQDELDLAISNTQQKDVGNIVSSNRVIAKLSRPEIAQQFMSPPPQKIVDALLQEGHITATQAALSQHFPVAQDVLVESDSGGHTDAGIASVLLPSIRALRDRLMQEYGYSNPIRIGAAGGIGTPEAIVSMLMLGADFFVTGSINQCTVEAGTSDQVKDLLQDIDAQDTAYAPAGDMFEMGAQVQVLRKGLLFANRANKLYELYQNHKSIEDIDPKLQRQIQDKYFQRSFDEVWQETATYLARVKPNELAAIEASPKKKMAAIFKWYFVHSTRSALSGNTEQRADFQIHCGPALGAFNQWVKGTKMQSWRHRHVADIAEALMQGAAQLLEQKLTEITGKSS